MKNRLPLLFLGLFLSLSLNAQLPNGSTAPDWTLTDIDGTTHNLYSYLDQGYTVYIDFFATWCGFCWNYHNTHAFEDLDAMYGSGGTDEVIVFAIDASSSTTVADIRGTGNNTLGDYTAGTNYSFFNPVGSELSTIASDYQVNGYPTIYGICSDKKITHVGQASTAALYNFHQMECLGFDIVVDNVIDENCYQSNDGAIEISLTGNTNGAFTYAWSNGSSAEDISGLTTGMYSCTVTKSSNGLQEVVNDIFVNGPLTPLGMQSESVQAVKCHSGSDGSVSVLASGSTPPYNYSWSNGSSGTTINGLTEGMYTVSVTDANNCLFSKLYVVSQPSALEMAVTAFPENCGNNDGAIEVSANGGTLPYLYNIGFGNSGNSTFENLNTGNYPVSVIDGNNCQEQIVQFVAENLDPIINIDEAGTLTCLVTNTVLDASSSEDGVSITYNWSTTNGTIIEGGDTEFPNVGSPGTYVLTLTNESTGCTSVDSIDVIGEYIFTSIIQLNASNTLTCNQPNTTIQANIDRDLSEVDLNWRSNGGSIIAGAESLTPTVNAPGMYFLDVSHKETGCISTDSVFVQADNDIPVITFLGNPQLTCLQQSVTIDTEISGTGNYIYLWTDQDGNQLSNEAFILVQEAGNYTLQVTNTDNDCVSTSTLNIEEDIAAPEFQIAGDANTLTCALTELEFSINASVSNIAVVWKNQDGQIISNSPQAIFTDGGTYTATVTNQLNGCVSNQSFIIDDQREIPSSAFSFDVFPNKIIVGVDEISIDPNTTYRWAGCRGVSESSTSFEFNFNVNELPCVLCLTATNDCGEDVNCTLIERPTELTSEAIEIIPYSRLTEKPTELEFNVFPNPADDHINIRTDAGQYSYQIIDVTGEIKLFDQVSGNTIIDVSTLDQGIFFVRMFNSDVSVVEKIIIGRTNLLQRGRD